MPMVRKVPAAEAQDWTDEEVWTNGMLKQITEGNAEGITRIRRGWRLALTSPKNVRIVIDFETREYVTLTAALRAVVKAREVIYHVFKDGSSQ